MSLIILIHILLLLLLRMVFVSLERINLHGLIVTDQLLLIMVNLQWCIRVISLVVSRCVTCHWHRWHLRYNVVFYRPLVTLICVWLSSISCIIVFLVTLFLPCHILLATDNVLLTWDLVKGLRSEKHIILIRIEWDYIILDHVLPHAIIVLVSVTDIIIVLLHIGKWVMVVIGGELCPLVDVSQIVEFSWCLLL